MWSSCLFFLASRRNLNKVHTCRLWLSVVVVCCWSLVVVVGCCWLLLVVCCCWFLVFGCFFNRQSPQDDTVTRRVTQVTVCAKLTPRKLRLPASEKDASQTYHILMCQVPHSAAPFKRRTSIALPSLFPPFPTAEGQSLVVLGAQHLTDRRALAPPQDTRVLG